MNTPAMSASKESRAFRLWLICRGIRRISLVPFHSSLGRCD